VSIGAVEHDRHCQRLARRQLTAAAELAGGTAWPGMAHVLRMERRVIDLHAGAMRGEAAQSALALAAIGPHSEHEEALWRKGTDSGKWRQGTFTTLGQQLDTTLLCRNGQLR
jgi:hypothetical protein